MSISPRVWCWPGTGPALWVLPSNSSPKFRPTRRKCTSQTEKSTSQFGLKGLFLGTGGTQRCPPRDFFVSHHRGAPPMPNPSPPCKTGRAGVWPIGACSGRNWGLRMRPQSPPGALNTEMWLGAKLFFRPALQGGPGTESGPSLVVATEQGRSPSLSAFGRVRSPVQSSTPEAKAPLRDGAGTKSAAVNNSPATGSKRLRLKHAGSSAERNALAGGTVDGNTNGDSKQLYAATDAGVKYSIDGDPQFVMAEDAAARAQFCMAEDKEFRKAEAAAARLPLEVTASLEQSAGQQPTAELEFCSKLPVRATAVRNAVADLNVSQYAMANVVVRSFWLLFRENLSVFFADAKRQTHKQRRRQHGLRSQACNSFCLGGRGRLPSCWPFGG